MLCQQASKWFREEVTRTAEAHFDTLQRERVLHGVHIPFLSSPVFFDSGDRLRIASLLEKVTSAIERVGDLFYSARTLPGNRSLHEHIPLSQRVLELCHLDCGQAPRLCVSRYDVITDPGGGTFQILEINPGDPSGAGHHDVALDGLLKSPATEALRTRVSLGVDHLLPLHRRALLEAGPDRGGARPAIIAFAVARESIVRDDHAIMAEAARTAGLQAHVADPRDFTNDDDALLLAGERIDLVWRDIIDEFTLDPYWEATQPFRAAYRRGGFALRNRFSVTFAACKGVFDILSDERNAPLFPPDEWAVLQAHIPWTRVLTDRRTLYEGKKVDLVGLIVDRREEFVIKPNLGCCGENVLVGRHCPAGVWQSRVAQAVASPGSDVVQRYCPPPAEWFPTANGVGEELRYVSSFWQFGERSRGRFAGSYIRASNKPVINIQRQGGGMSTIFWV